MTRQAVKLRDQAARPTRRRLRADRRDASQEVRQLLAVIEERLFEPDFDVNGLWRQSGVKKWAATPFADHVGMQPGGYIASLRLEVGGALLARTRLKVFQIAEVLGYGAARDTFSKAFQRWSGKVPLQYRRDARTQNEPVLVETDPRVAKLIDEVDLASSAGDLAGARRGLARAEAVLRDQTVADQAARLGLTLHERGADRVHAGDVDRAYDDLTLAHGCYAAAGELPPAIVRQRRYVPVSDHTDEVLYSALCSDCGRRLASDEGRSMRDHLSRALLLVPREDPWFEGSCDDCYGVAWSAISRARLGLMSDAWKAWWLSSNVDPKDREAPPSRGRFIAAMAEVERLYSGDQLERKGYAEKAVEDAVALGDPLLEAESRLWLGAVLGAMSESTDAQAQIDSAKKTESSPWLLALRERVIGLFEYFRSNYPKALERLQFGVGLYKNLDAHLAGLLLIQQGNVHFEVGEYELFGSLNEKALSFLDGRRDAVLGAGVVPIHLARAFVLLGEWEKAELALSKCLFDRAAHRRLAATELLTRACLALLSGQVQISARLFLEAQERFAELNVPNNAAVAASYSVEAYARMGHRSKAIETAVIALRFFQAAGCAKEGLDAIGKLRNLLESEVIDSTAVTATVRYLTRRHGGWLPDPYSRS